MNTLTYARAHNLPQLAEELFAAFPAWATTLPGGQRLARVTISGEDLAITLSVPDDADEAAIAAVVNAHVVNANYGRDLAFEAAVTWLKGTAWPILQTSPPGALTALQQNAYNKAVLVMVRRLFQELR